jgi:hypothetical protein
MLLLEKFARLDGHTSFRSKISWAPAQHFPTDLASLQMPKQTISRANAANFGPMTSFRFKT